MSKGSSTSTEKIMSRIKSIESFNTFQTLLKPREDVRLKLFMCAGTSCLSSEADIMIEMFQKLCETHNLSHQCAIIKTGCFGFCGQGPILRIEPGDYHYVQVKVEDVDEIFHEHILNKRIVKRLLYRNPHSDEISIDASSMDFYQKQHRIALKNCGHIDPEIIDEYIANGGYTALSKALSEMTPFEVISCINESGLRGRGGGGFSTGVKWEVAFLEESSEKYIICNADEGDPGAFMDRAICEGDPHSIIEGMIIAAYATKATRGFIYIRAEYALATKRLQIAIDQARAYGILGTNILGTLLSFDISIKIGAGAFVCGEETALIRSIEGGRGEPRNKPPYPSVSGYHQKPTVVNNVETLANVANIIVKGSAWFRNIGTSTSPGTKVFALAGHVRNIGLVEVPMGTTFREIIYDIGGGHPQDRRIKAIQIGGPSGGVITQPYFDTPIDYESLKAIGAMMGSGGMIVMDEDSDMVEVAKFYLDFTQDESCGQCTPCRIGTKRMLEILERLTSMQGSIEDLESLRSLGEIIKWSSLCGLGQTAPNPVLSTLTHFREEYEAYAYRTKKKAYSIDPAKCIGCTKCARICPVSCIEGKVKQQHFINEALCIACGACFTACPVNAIIRP
jgi:NADH:ubiquinone oxidoreductase subunit F (NADH-binding)/(2Fe-2S) ferredoxin/ferredoxin